DVEAGLERAGALELVDPDPVAQAFHAEPPELLEAKEPFHQPCRVLGQVDLAGLGELLHALRQTHGRAERGVVHVQVVADRARSASSIDPFTSAKSTVTCLRSPSSRPRDARIFSARWAGAWGRRSGGATPPTG